LSLREQIADAIGLNQTGEIGFKELRRSGNVMDADDIRLPVGRDPDQRHEGRVIADDLLVAIRMESRLRRSNPEQGRITLENLI
jgi:hypothetical protein